MFDTEEWREKGEQCLGRRMSWSWDHGAVDTGLSLSQCQYNGWRHHAGMTHSNTEVGAIYGSHGLPYLITITHFSRNVGLET